MVCLQKCGLSQVQWEVFELYSPCAPKHTGNNTRPFKTNHSRRHENASQGETTKSTTKKTTGILRGGGP